ncbi:hypothetical protein LWI28_004078 [Acer negundo]|uniref:Uncharacterized protein n=1 Tax=Acer negundo TaxID=4023 RepID=A0AAD5IC08_ACENE|nr:hypothetical protein LWI28_004078 [Acer negundo]
MANGEKLKCEEVVHEVKMNVQGVRIAADLHVLSLVGVDVVLGNAWLKSIAQMIERLCKGDTQCFAVVNDRDRQKVKYDQMRPMGLLQLLSIPEKI